MTSPGKREKTAGCLYLVATPIGNLEDISLRALRVLKEADLIACEDTRQTMKLLAHYSIRKRLESYHEHNEMTRAPELVIELEQGAQIALVSDAGTPVVSDPGHRLVSLCLRHGIPVVPVPGPSAMVAALAASGLATEEFVFLGFLPSRVVERRKMLRTLVAEPRTLVCYEAPHRILETLGDALDVLGNRTAVIAREVTKLHEEFLRGRLEELVSRFANKPPRGEITLLIGADDGAERAATTAAERVAAEPLTKRVQAIMRERGLDQKAALKQAARERGLTKREAYKEMLVNRGNGHS
jgi:16S rRNA (cytidine1402-2'-O)-methyltransferase